MEQGTVIVPAGTKRQEVLGCKRGLRDVGHVVCEVCIECRSRQELACQQLAGRGSAKPAQGNFKT